MGVCDVCLIRLWNWFGVLVVDCVAFIVVVIVLGIVVAIVVVVVDGIYQNY